MTELGTAEVDASEAGATYLLKRLPLELSVQSVHRCQLSPFTSTNSSMGSYSEVQCESRGTARKSLGASPARMAPGANSNVSKVAPQFMSLEMGLYPLADTSAEHVSQMDSPPEQQGVSQSVPQPSSCWTREADSLTAIAGSLSHESSLRF